MGQDIYKNLEVFVMERKQKTDNKKTNNQKVVR